MGKERIETGKAPQILIGACDGDLIVRGGPEPTLLVRGDYEVEETAEGYRLAGRGDLRLIVPTAAGVSVDEVSGNLIVKGVSGAYAIGHVYGNAVLVEAGPARIDAVHGDLSARGGQSLAVGEVHGDADARRTGGLALRQVFGDATARAIAGPVTIEQVSGDADLRGIEGDVAVGRAHGSANVAYAKGQVTLGSVNGDIRLRGLLSPGNHALAARGDIVLRWPGNAPLNLVAAGRSIDNRLPLQDIIEKDGRLTARIGAGETYLTLSADGRVILKEADPDEKWEFGPEGEEFEFEAAIGGLGLENIGARIEAEVNGHLARVAREFETRFGPDFGQRLAEKAARQAERAAERAERAGERSRRKGEWRGRAPGLEASPPPAATRRTVSPEEQLKILKMVESGAITPEDAGMLLEALEG
jgi:hypothetical protein